MKKLPEQYTTNELILEILSELTQMESISSKMDDIKADVDIHIGNRIYRIEKDLLFFKISFCLVSILILLTLWIK